MWMQRWFRFPEAVVVADLIVQELGRVLCAVSADELDALCTPASSSTREPRISARLEHDVRAIAFCLLSARDQARERKP
jgi:hypothetical protein